MKKKIKDQMPVLLDSGIFPNMVEVRYGAPDPLAGEQDRSGIGGETWLTCKCKRCEKLKTDCSILVWTKEKKLDVLMHELCHVVMIVLDRAGVPLDKATNEVTAYLMGHYVQQLQRQKVI